jgi:hypothetical protein
MCSILIGGYGVKILFHKKYREIRLCKTELKFGFLQCLPRMSKTQEYIAATLPFQKHDPHCEEKKPKPKDKCHTPPKWASEFHNRHEGDGK